MGGLARFPGCKTKQCDFPSSYRQPNRLLRIAPHPQLYKMFNCTSQECPRPLTTAEKPPIA